MAHSVPADPRQQWTPGWRLATLATAAAVAAAGCGIASQRPGAPSTPQARDLLAGITTNAAAVQAAADSGNALTIDLLKQLELSSPGGNLVDSAFSLATVLSMLELGARAATQSQIAAVLHSVSLTAEQEAAAWEQLDEALLETAKTDGISLDAANAIWLQRGLPVSAAFLYTLGKDFSAPSSQIDFQGDPEGSADLINHWVSDATRRMIPSIVTPDEVQPCLVVLADAIYFDAHWEYQFDPSLTSSGAFFRPDNSQVTAAMMHSEPSTLPTYSGNGVTAVELPYVGGHYVADIVMPTSRSLAAFIASLSPGDLPGIEQHLVSTPGVRLTLPKFDISSQLSLIPILTALGMSDAFSGAADFSGIDGRTDLSIGLAKQSARIQVDEAGTTAAAATIVGMISSAEVGGVNLLIDHPFLFIIRDTATGSIIFTAQVTDPTASS